MTTRPRLLLPLFLLLSCSDPAGPTGNLGPGGATLEFLEGKVVLDVPAGAVGNDVDVVVRAATAVPSPTAG